MEKELDEPRQSLLVVPVAFAHWHTGVRHRTRNRQGQNRVTCVRRLRPGWQESRWSRGVMSGCVGLFQQESRVGVRRREYCQGRLKRLLALRLTRSRLFRNRLCNIILQHQSEKVLPPSVAWVACITSSLLSPRPVPWFAIQSKLTS